MVQTLAYDIGLFGFMVVVGDENISSTGKIVGSYRKLFSMIMRIARELGERRDSNVLFKDVLFNLGYGIHVVDNNLRLVYFNRSIAKNLGWTEDDIGQPIIDIFPSMAKLGHENIYREVFRTGRGVATEEASFLGEGDKRFVRTSLIPISSPEHGISRIVTVIEDITRQRELSEELKDTMRELKVQASTDALTGLYNYRYFSDALPKMIVTSREAKASLCLVVLDLDNLKAYNDLGGHHYGDTLLRVVAHILVQHQTPGDITARYGGDEFVMILRNTNVEGAKNRAELIRTNILAYPFRDEEFLTGGDITASFGVALLTDDIEDADDLMRRADRALYRAKDTGKNRVCVWEET